MNSLDESERGSFRDRTDAGIRLAARLMHFAGRSDVLVLALPRGGVPVGYEVARALGVPLDVFVVRKLGVPGHEELAMGAIASNGTRVLNNDVIRDLQITPSAIEDAVDREGEELERREAAYRGGRPRLEVRDRVVILVDDGLATGATMRAAAAALRMMDPARIVAAVPVGARETCRELERDADEVVCLIEPEPFIAVGTWYNTFDQTTDEEVRKLLSRGK